MAAIIAAGVNTDGRREIVGLLIAPSMARRQSSDSRRKRGQEAPEGEAETF